LLDGDTFAVSAIDMAAHDWHARKHGLSTWQWWQLDWQQVPLSSYTLAIDSIEVVLDKLRQQPDWPIYKIKLGAANDLEIVDSIRRATSAKLRVDANCGWDVEQTLANSAGLKELGVEFIEQPLPREATAQQQQAVFESSCLPLMADESCQMESDVMACGSTFHGINIKLCKCGGLTPALNMIRQARALGLKTMIGCMVESSIGISAAAQLLPLLDFADLDGAALLAHDPSHGIRVVNGFVSKPTEPGHGSCLL
jgi:L-Ala-D/L-Glu epimerase